MDVLSVIDLLKTYIPRRWFRKDSHADRLLKVLAAGVIFAFAVTETLRRETLTKTAVDSLEEKERAYGLPIGESLTVEERRNRITARRWQRGGPTSKKQFEEGMKLLTGYECRVIPNYPNFSVEFELIEAPPASINLEVVEDFIRRNKLAHLSHNIVFLSTDEVSIYMGFVLYTGDQLTIEQVV